MSRDFSKISSRLWRSAKFQKLDDFARLLYLYFLTCPHASSVGIYNCPIHYISGDLKRTDKQIKAAIKKIDEAGLILWNAEEELVCITNWARFNMPHNRNHARRLVIDSMLAPGCCEKWMALEDFMRHIPKNKIDPEDLKEMSKEIRHLRIQYPNRSDTVSLLDHTRLDHTGTHGIDDAGGDSEFELDGGEQQVNRFDELWAICPKNGRRKGSKTESVIVYEKLIGDGVSHSVIIEGTKAYAAYLAATGEKNMDFQRFLKKKMFAETWPIPPNNGGGGSGGGGLDDAEQQLRERAGE